MTYLRAHPDYWDNPIDAAFAPLVNELVAKSKAKVVISSSHRHARNTSEGFTNQARSVEELQKMLTDRGYVVEVVGATPKVSGERRHAIRRWLEQNPHITSYVILDDEESAAMDGRLVLTDPKVGLTQANVESALQLLGIYS